MGAVDLNGLCGEKTADVIKKAMMLMHFITIRTNCIVYVCRNVIIYYLNFYCHPEEVGFAFESVFFFSGWFL